MKKFNLKFFCDFDGTVTKNDIWVHSLGRFIKNQEKFKKICDDFSLCLITGRDCIRKELELVEDFDTDTFNKYLDEEELDDNFKVFTEFCEDNNYEIILVSEGLDYYIKYILNKEGINLRYYCNKMIIKNINGKIKLDCEFPYPDEHCNFCGMSKRNIILKHTNDYDNDVSVFIGDGVSDFCAANYADFVFAKKALASYCWKNNITYFEFNNFSDIVKKIEKLVSQNKIKHRQTAKYNRREVFLGG